MKFIQETTLTVFSILMLIISILSTVIIFGWLDFGVINNAVNGILESDNLRNIILALNILFIVASIICIFYDDRKSSGAKDGILLENEKGNLLISRSALTKIIDGVVNTFDSVKVNSTRISLDKEGKLNIDIQISVTKDVIIKDLTNNLQIKVKEAIKKSSDLEVKTVNVGIQNVIEEDSTAPQA